MWGSRPAPWPADGVLSVWAGETVDGDRVGALLELETEHWRALEEVDVPRPVRRWALGLVAAAG